MSSLANRARAGFLRLLRAGGCDHRVFITKRGTYNPATGNVAASDPDGLLVLGRMMNARNGRTSDGDTTFSRMMLFAPQDARGVDFTPKPGNWVADGADCLYEFADVAPHQMHGITVGWRVSLKAGR